MAEKIVLSQQEYNLRQIKEALGADNKYYCWQKSGHSPDNNEALCYYIESGGAKNFSDKYIPEKKKEDENS